MRPAGTMSAAALEPVTAEGETGAATPLPLRTCAPPPRTGTVVLLGGARLEETDGMAPLERKQAALLAYVALEGEAARSRLRALLWPEADERRASASLRQLLCRLRQLGKGALFAHDDPVILRPSLRVDARELEASAAAGAHARVLALSGGLLDGHDFEDCPELEQWLLRARERHEAFRDCATDVELSRLERAGRLSDAITLARVAVSRGPVREELYRRLMRLQLAAGDRAAALRTFQRCAERLRSELDVGPMPETMRLARELAPGSLLPTERTPVPPAE